MFAKMRKTEINTLSMRGQKLRPGWWEDNLVSTLVAMDLVKTKCQGPSKPAPQCGVHPQHRSNRAHV